MYRSPVKMLTTRPAYAISSDHLRQTKRPDYWNDIFLLFEFNLIICQNSAIACDNQKTIQE